MDTTRIIALEARLRNCPEVLTLGVRPNFADYSDTEMDLIRRAPKIYYPSAFYADLFNALGKATFPSYHTYKFAQDKIKQTAIFQMAGISHPRTRVFYGKRQKQRITDYFSLPLVAKVPRGSALGRGVFLIRNHEDLARYCNDHPVAYIQQYLPVDRDMRIVVVGKRIVHAYWRIAGDNDFRSNLGAGGRIDLSPVPEQARRLALHAAATCGWDDVGLDICLYDSACYILEANMKYGREGFRSAGMDYHRMIGAMIRNGHI